MADIVPHGVPEDSDFVIDEIVTRCSDDMHGALKALLLINEQLEAELVQLRSGLACGTRAPRRANVSLH